MMMIGPGPLPASAVLKKMACPLIGPVGPIIDHWGNARQGENLPEPPGDYHYLDPSGSLGHRGVKGSVAGKKNDNLNVAGQSRPIICVPIRQGGKS